MNKAVDEPHENRMTTADVFQSDPRQKNHSTMMVNMKERYVTLLLFQNEESRVKKVNDFSQKIVMSDYGYLNFVVIFGGVINRLAKPTVPLTKTMIVALNENVWAHCNLKEIIALDDVMKLVRLTILHELRSQVEHQVEVNGDNC